MPLALRAQTALAPLRMVVEKELLHHHILREMAEAGLLQTLTFIGGTCLSACYGSGRAPALTAGKQPAGEYAYPGAARKVRAGRYDFDRHCCRCRFF